MEMNIQSLNSAVIGSLSPPRQQQTSAEATSVPPPAVAAQAPQETPTTAQSAPGGLEQINEAVKATNDFVSLVNSAVEFTVDDDTKLTVVKVIDKSTKEVIRQIPSEEMLAIAKALDTVQGLLVRQKV